MAKIFSGLTLLVALAAIFFGFKTKELVETLQDKGKKQHTELVETQAKLKKTQKELDDTKAELETVKGDLKTAQDKLAMTEADLAKSKTELADALQKKTDAETQYAAIKKNYDDLKASFGDKTPEQITKEIADMQTANKELTAKVAEMEIKVTEQKLAVEELTRQKKETESKIVEQAKVVDRYRKGVMQNGTSGQVLAVNAGWGFCVLSIGDKRGAAANKILIVTRGGQAIGKVRIINVEASQSVADIIPSTFAKGVYVQPGDGVIYTGEDKVREEPAPAGQTPPANITPPAPSPTAPPSVPGLTLPTQ